jgi:predicted amidohydrolase
MMKPIRVAAAQFENKNGDKAYNLSRIRDLTGLAVEKGAEIISFHEACIPAYTFLRNSTRDEVAALAEPIPGGPSVKELMGISSTFGIPVLAGLIEDDQGTFYNTYICVQGNRLVARHRKLHAFINPHISSGNEYCVFELLGCRCGILICYDNNVIENVRITALMGAEIIFMPHVTCCLPLPMPGTG